MPNTTITQYGLDAVSSASTIGTLLAPYYFVPVYDYRIDNFIHDSTIPASAYSACINVSATLPEGEIIWNTDLQDYSLSPINESYLISAGNATSAYPNQIINPVQSQKWQVNLKNSSLLTSHWVGTSATFNAATQIWNISTDTALVSGSNATPTGLSKYFPITDYYPVSADNPISRLRGNVKCRLAKNIGECKFNKIAIFSVRQDEFGQIINEEPTFFAECFLKTTVVKTSIGNNGFDTVEADIQIDVLSLSANWNDVMFTTSGDYWDRVPGGLHFSEKISVGEFGGDTDEPQAVVHIRPPRGSEENLFMMERGTHDFKGNVNSTGYTELAFSNGTLSANNGVYLEVYDSSGNAAIYPFYTSSVDLGAVSNGFRDLYITGDAYMKDIHMQDLYCTEIITTALTITDIRAPNGFDLVIGSNFTPSGTSAIDLGSVTNSFKDLYIAGVSYLVDIHMQDLYCDEITSTLITTDSAKTDNLQAKDGGYDITLAANIIPRATGIYSLGSATKKYYRIYGNTFYGTDIYTDQLYVDRIAGRTSSTIYVTSKIVGSDDVTAPNLDDKVNENTVNAIFPITGPSTLPLPIDYREYEDGTVELSWDDLTGLDSLTQQTANGAPLSAVAPSSGRFIPINSAGAAGYMTIGTGGELNLLYGSAVTFIGSQVVRYRL